MNWLEVKNQMRASLDELSSRGAIIPNVKVADILAKAKYFVNPIIYDLASTTGRLAKSQSYIVNPLCNSLSYDTSSIKQHLPGTDFSITLTNARATFFEAGYPGEIVIEESADNGATYTEIETINVPSTVTAFAEYKRLIFPSLSTNLVRLRFTGDYVYSFRNYILYPYSWPTEADVQQHRSSFEFDLPSDYLMLDQWMAKYDARQYRPYSNVTMLPTKKFAVNRYEGPLELQLVYWRKPNLLVFTGIDATDDAQELDCTEDASQIVALGIAAKCFLSEKDETAGMVMQNLYEVSKATLPGNDNFYAANFVINNNEW